MARSISGRKGGSRGPKAAPAAASGALPSPDDIVRYVSENPDRASKRDIAKAFGIKGGDRIWLKDTLRELEDAGRLQGGRRSFARPGALPPVTALEIFGRARAGGLLARPGEQPEDADPVVVSVRTSRWLSMLPWLL